MSMGRDAFAKRVESLLDKPDILVRMCMEQYDAKLRAELALGELRKQTASQADLYREVLGRCTAAEKQNVFFRNRFAEYEERVAALTEALSTIQKRYETVLGENGLLKQANDELKKSFVDAVEAGRMTQGKLDETEREIKNLHARICSLQDQISLGNRERFGATSEKTETIFGRNGENGDPLDEKADPDDPGQKRPAGRSGKGTGYSADKTLKEIKKRTAKETGGNTGAGRTPRPKGKREEDFSRLDQVNFYDYDLDELDRKYGKGSYRIVNFKCKKTLRETRPHNYVYNEYTPVIAVKNPDGKEKIISMPGKQSFYPGSFASKSLVTSILTKRYCMALPVYRLEKEYLSRGIPLSRQTMTNWIIHFALEVFAPVYDRMQKELDRGGIVRQCDETTWRVIIWPEEDKKEGRKNGSKGYIWLHTTGEFAKSHKVFLYSFEKTRGADHLRRMLKGMVGYLVSDAYAAYYTTAKESGGLIKTVMCWMHCRRMLARAVMVMDPGLDELTMEEVLESPEVKGLMKANEIFEAETPLKKLTPEERLLKRKELVGPLVDEFFAFIHSIDPESPEISERMREAVTYAVNQEEGLRMFLENGEIPMDNGYVERGIKPVALSRRNSLFSFSMVGAECSAIMYSIVETAKANEADVYTYLKYLLSEMPGHLDDTDYSFLDDMMPWSLKYRAYEKRELETHADEKVPESNDPPPGVKIKKKSDRAEEAA